MKQPTSEMEYIQAFIDGDEAACAALVELYYPQLLMFCRSQMTGPESIFIEDIVHDTTEVLILRKEKILENIKESRSLKSYLFVIAKNKINDLYRENSRHADYVNEENDSKTKTILSTGTTKGFDYDKEDVESYDNEDCPDDCNQTLAPIVKFSVDEKNEILYKKHLTIIDDCIDFQLSSKQRELMRMRVYDQITNDEIAHRMGKTTSSISSEFSKSLAILEEALDETSFRILKALTKRQISTTLESERLLINDIK